MLVNINNNLTGGRVIFMSTNRLRKILAILFGAAVIFIFYMILYHTPNTTSNIIIYICSLALFLLVYLLSLLFIRKIKINRILDKLVGAIILLGGGYMAH